MDGRPSRIHGREWIAEANSPLVAFHGLLSSVEPGAVSFWHKFISRFSHRGVLISNRVQPKERLVTAGADVRMGVRG